MGRSERVHHARAARLNTAPAPDPIDAKLAALADPQRRRAVELLGTAPRRAGELAAELGLSPPALSRHLRVLKASGLVTETHPEFDARVRVYALREGGLDAVKHWLAQAEGGWAAQLAALRDHLAAERGGPPE